MNGEVEIVQCVFKPEPGYTFFSLLRFLSLLASVTGKRTVIDLLHVANVWNTWAKMKITSYKQILDSYF